MIQMTVTRLEKTSKTVYTVLSTEVKNIDSEFYKNVCEAGKFMKRLGGTEKQTKNYTPQGYKVTKIVSTSPDKENRTIYEFKFN